MSSFVDLFFGYFSRIINLFNSYTFSIAGVSIGIFEIIFGFLALGLVFKTFWRGA